MLARDPQAEVDVYERRNDISFLSCGIYLYLENQVDISDVFYSSAKELEALGPNVHVHLQHDVTRVDTKAKFVEVQNLANGEMTRVPYDKLLMTTGSRPALPTIEGVELPHVKLCKNYDDALDIQREVGMAKRMVIVGGGYIGTEIAEAVSKRGLDVTLVNGFRPMLSHYVDTAISDQIKATLAENGVQIRENEVCTGFKQGADGLIVITNLDEITVDFAVICVGFSPVTELVNHQVALDSNNAILVNEYMQTSQPDVYAAGDSAAVHYNPTGEAVYAPLATNAVRMGKIAGANIVTPKRMRYMGTQATNALSIFGRTLACTGLTARKAKEKFPNAATVYVTQNYRPDFMPTNAKLHMVLVYNRDNRQILGAQFYSEYDVSMCANLISVMIQNKNTIDDLSYVDMLFNPTYNQPWHYLNLLGQVAVAKADEA